MKEGSAESQSPCVAPGRTVTLPFFACHDCVWQCHQAQPGVVLTAGAPAALDLLRLSKDGSEELPRPGVGDMASAGSLCLLAAPHCHLVPCPSWLEGHSCPVSGFSCRELQTLTRAVPPAAWIVLTTSMCSEPGMPGTPGSGGGWCEQQGLPRAQTPMAPADRKWDPRRALANLPATPQEEAAGSRGRLCHV